MDVTGVIARLENALATQVRLAEGDAVIEGAAEALLVALEPAVRQAVLEMAEQAAVEVGSQLPAHAIDVVLRDGEPALVVRSEDAPSSFALDDLEARLTLRLPATLKGLIEESATESGDSVNAYVVKALAGRAGQRRSMGQRMRGTVES